MTIQNYVMRLRKALGTDGGSRITTLPSGYSIRAEPGELDVTRFEDLLGAATAAAREGRWQDAAAQAHSASRCGGAIRSPTSAPGCSREREVPRLAEMRLQALETRNDADLHLGRHADVITGLQRLTACHPLASGCTPSSCSPSTVTGGRPRRWPSTSAPARSSSRSSAPNPAPGCGSCTSRYWPAIPPWPCGGPVAAGTDAASARPGPPRELPGGRCRTSPAAGASWRR